MSVLLRRSLARFFTYALISAIYVEIPAGMAEAATWNGGGGNNNWTTPGNWGGIAPNPFDDLTFDGLLRLINNNDFAASTAFNSITFNSGAGPFVLSGNAVTLPGNITDNATTAQTIGLPLLLTAPSTVSVTSGGTLTIGGVISSVDSSMGITKADLGTLVLSGANTYSGPTNIGTTAAGGTLTVGVGGTLGDGTSQLSIGGGSNVGALDLTANSATVGGLTVSSNTQTADTITIGSGKSLTVNGNVLLGGLSGTAVTSALTITGNGATANFGNGTGGTFVVSNRANANGPATTNASMDLSGVTNVNINYGSSGAISVGAGTTGLGDNAPFGKLTLGTNNTLTAGTIGIGLNNGGGNTGKAFLLLGTTNVFNVDSIKVAAGKTQPTTFSQTNPDYSAVMKFNTGLVNPSITLRGTAGGQSRVNNFLIVDGSLYTGSSGTNESGLVDFTGGTVDALINNLVVGTGVANTNTAATFAFLNFNAGTIDVNTLVLAKQGVTPGAATNGTINMSGTANLTVNTSLTLGSRASNSGTMTANLNVNGGTLKMGGDIFTLGVQPTTLGGAGVNGILTLDGGTIDMQGHNLGTATGPITSLVLKNGTLRNVGGVNSIISFSPATASTSLVKSAAGTITLAGNNTYAGSTIVSGGTLAVTGTTLASGIVQVNATASGSGTLSGTGSTGQVTLGANNGTNLAHIAPGATSADGQIGTLTMSSLTVNGGDFRYDFAAGNASDKIVVTGNANFSGVSTFTPSSFFAPTGLYTFLSAGSLSVTNLPTAPISRSSYTFTYNDGTHVDPGVALNTMMVQIGFVPPKSLLWTGGNGGNPGDNVTWVVNNGSLTTAKNWQDNTPAVETFFNADSVTFDNTAASKTITISGSVQPNAITVNNTAGNDYTFSGTGSIDGIGSLTKSGSGGLTINTTASYGGSTLINANSGTTVLTKGNSGNGNITIGSGSTLRMGATGAAGSISLGSGNIANDGTFIINRTDGTFAAPAVLSNAITGAGSVQILGSGTTSLTGANTFSNGLLVGSSSGTGTVRVPTVAAAGTGLITVSTGGQLVFTGAGITIPNTITLAGGQLASINSPTAFSGDITVTAASTISLSDPQNFGTTGAPVALSEMNFTGSLHGSAALNVTAGIGTATVDAGPGFRLRGAASDYTGTITFGQGVKAELQTTVPGPAQYSSAGIGSKIILATGTLTGSLAGTYTELNLRNNTTGDVDFANNVEVTGTGFTNINPIGTITTPGTISKLGTLKMLPGQTLGVNRNGTPALTVQFGSTTLAGAGNYIFSPTTSGSGWSGTGNNLILGDISQTGTTKVLMQGSGTLFLNGTNSFTGGLSISAGVVQLGTSGALNSNAVTFDTYTPVGASTAIGSTGTLRLNGFNTTLSDLQTDPTTPGTPSVDAGPASATLTVNNSASNTWAGTLADDGAQLSLTKSNTGTLILTGTNTYSGNTTISAGTLQIGNASTTGSLGTGPVTVNSPGSLVFNRANDANYDGTISGNGTVQQTGTGMLTLSQVHNYTGATTVGAGSLVVNGSLLNTGAVAVSGGALGGTGSVGNVTMSGTGSIRPGFSSADGNVGILTLNSLVVQGGDFRVDVGGSVDLVNVTGNANFTAASTFSPIFFPLGTPPQAGSYDLLKAASITHSVDPTLNLPSTTRQIFSLPLVDTDSNSVVDTVRFTVAGNAANVTWVGNNGSAWDANITNNWTSQNVADNKFFNLDVATFDDTSSNHNVLLAQDITPSSAIVNTAGTYTIDTNGHKIAGISTTLVLQGGGTLILKDSAITPGTNSFVGGIDLGNDTLELGVGGSLSTGPINGSGGTLRINRSGSLTIANLLTGSTNLEVKAGAIVTLTNINNTLAGTANVLNGQLKIGASGALPGPTTVALGDAATNSNGLLDLNGTNLTVNGLTANGTGVSNIVTNTNATKNSTLTFDGGTSVFSGIIQQGTKTMSLKVQNGSLTLTGVNTYTGSNTVSTGGTLSFSTNTNLGAATNTISLNNNGNLQATGTVSFGSSRTIALGTGGGTIEVTGANVLTVPGVISGSTALTKIGSGKLVLSAVNTYTGVTNINGGGTVEAARAKAFAGLTGQVHFLSGTFHVTDPLNVDDPNNPDPNFDAHLVVSAGTSNKYTTSGTGGSTGTFDVDSGVTLQVGALVNGAPTSTTAGLQTAGSGTAGGSFTKAGLGTIRIVSQNNQQDTAFNLVGGTVDLWHPRGLGGIDSAAVKLNMSNGTTLVLTQDADTDFLTNLMPVDAGGTVNVTVNRLTAGAGVSNAFGPLQSSTGDFTMHVTSGAKITSGSAAFNLGQASQTNTLGGNATFDVVNNGAIPMAMNVPGVVTGGFGVTKTGTGTLTLAGTNNYTGTTTVTGGTLRVNGSHTGGGNYTVGSAATLGGIGSIGSSVTVNTGGFLAPGIGVGTLTASNVTFGSGATLNIDLNDGDPAVQDVLNVTGGALTLNSSAVNFNATGTLAKQVYVFAKYGTLTGNPFATANVPSGYSINYNYQNLNEIALVSPYLLGDYDRNGIVNAADVPAMLSALTNLTAYKNSFAPALTDPQLLAIGDFDHSNSLTNLDIQPMLDYVASFQAGPGAGGVAAVPEPASLVLIGLGGIALLAAHRRRRS